MIVGIEYIPPDSSWEVCDCDVCKEVKRAAVFAREKLPGPGDYRATLVLRIECSIHVPPVAIPGSGE